MYSNGKNVDPIICMTRPIIGYSLKIDFDAYSLYRSYKNFFYQNKA